MPSHFIRLDRRFPGQYIVQLAPSESSIPVAHLAAQIAGRVGAKVLATYTVGFKGFAVEIPGPGHERLARRLLDDDQVVAVEENAVARLAQSAVQNTLIGPPQYPNAHLWNLDRVDQDDPNRFDFGYGYCSYQDGAGVRIYVVDGGVDGSHVEFVGRFDAAAGLGPFLGAYDPGSPCFFDSSGRTSHGTSVASIAAGATFGVAKGATIVDVHVFNCAGESSAAAVLKALEWIYAHDDNRGQAASVINMSFALSRYDSSATALNSMISSMVNDPVAKIKIVAAAGNAEKVNDVWTPVDISWFVPANNQDVITVGASARDADSAWAGSNYGPISIWAPGQWVESASTITKSRFPSESRDHVRSELSDCDNYLDSCTSGTSFASPLVAGLVAR